MSLARVALLFVFALGALGAWWTLRGEPEPSAAPAVETPARAPAAEPAAPRGRQPAVPSSEPGPGPTEEPRTGVAERWVERNRRAIADLEAGAFDRAVEGFEACLEAVPDERIFAGNLAEALARRANHAYELGDAESRERAIADLERAVELASEREGLAQRLARWRRVASAEGDFWRDESEHFELAYDGARGEILHGAHVLIEELEKAYLDFGELFGLFPVESGRPKIRVVLYRRDTFDAVTGIGHWAGGVYDGTVRVPVEDLSRERSRLARVLRHELVHAFVKEVGGPRVPGWLNEGLAQLLEWSSPTRRQGAVGRARAALQGHEPFPLERLRGTLASWKNAEEIRRAYAQVLVMAYEIEFRFGRSVLFGMVAANAEDESAEDAFRRLTGATLEDVVADLWR